MFKILIIASRYDAGVGVQVTSFDTKEQAETAFEAMKRAEFEHKVEVIKLYKE